MKTVRYRGFTLIELMVTLAVLGILLGIAAPSFNQTLEQARHRTQMNQLLTDLNFARNQAITSRQPVTLCAGQDACDGNDQWVGRMMIFRDPNLNGQFDAGETLLQVSEIGGSLHWNWSSFRNQPHLSFRTDGTTNDQNGSLSLCHGREVLKAFKINITGRTRLDSQLADNDCD